MPRPTYSGRQNPVEFQRWSQGELWQWFRRKRAALDAAKAVYEGIRELVAPEWEIAAAARVGMMWLQMIHDIRSTPEPPGIQERDELESIWDEDIDYTLEPWIQSAVGAFEYCLITATRLRLFSDWARVCERELGHLDPSEYPVLTELRSRATHESHDVVEMSPLLSLD